MSVKRAEIPSCACGCGQQPPVLWSDGLGWYVQFRQADEAGWRRRGSPRDGGDQVSVERNGRVWRTGGDPVWWCPISVATANRPSVRISRVVRVDHVAA